MFGFSKTSKDPLSDAKSAERWLASLPANDLLAMHGAVLIELGALADGDARRTPARLDAVFCVDESCDRLRRSLIAQYLEHGALSSRIENQLWQALFDLTQGFLLCYQAFAKDASHYPAANSKWRLQMPTLVARQIAHLGIDGKIRLYRYEQWIPARWADLYSLFRMACSEQIERKPAAALTSGMQTTIEHEFLQALLIQLVNSGNLAPHHVEWASEQLAHWCAPLRLSLEPSSATTFYVDLGSRAGLRRRGPQPLEGHVLFLDTRPLHAVMLQNIVMLEQKVREDPLSERTSHLTDQLVLFNKLAAQVDPEFRPMKRRGERTSANGSVDAIVGFAKIAGFLRDEEARSTGLVRTESRSFDDSLEIATFGRVRNENARIVDVARQRLATYASPGGSWEIRDRSQTGLRLIAPMTAMTRVTLGTLVALRDEAGTAWTLGIVRRMKRQTAARADIGLQIIANDITDADLEEQKRTEVDYVSDGMATTVSNRRVEALSLSLRKADGEAPVRTVVVASGDYKPGKRYLMTANGASHRIVFGRLLEQSSDWVWATVDVPEGVTARSRVASK